MRKTMLVKGNTPEEFALAYNEAQSNVPGEVVNERFVSDTVMYLFYEEEEVTDDLIEDIRKMSEDNFHADFAVDATDPEEEEEDATTIRVEMTIAAPKGRFCCECDNFNWGKGCPFKDEQHIRRMDSACGLFNVYFGRRCR